MAVFHFIPVFKCDLGIFNGLVCILVGLGTDKNTNVHLGINILPVTWNHQRIVPVQILQPFLTYRVTYAKMIRIYSAVKAFLSDLRPKLICNCTEHLVAPSLSVAFINHLKFADVNPEKGVCRFWMLFHPLIGLFNKIIFVVQSGQSIKIGLIEHLPLIFHIHFMPFFCH